MFCLDDQNNLFIPLIERYAYKGFHSAQISFPGGKFEEEDIHLQNTALRECFEEIGLQNEIALRCVSLPDDDRRSPDEILGYDEFGLPA